MDYLQCNCILFSALHLQGMIHDPKKLARQGRFVLCALLVSVIYTIYFFLS